MASLTWIALCAAIAVIAAAPNDYSGYSGYGNSVQPQQPQDVPENNFCTGKENGAFGEGCSKDYWLCWEGMATAQECSFELMFNEENGQCDFPANVFACSGQPTTTLAPADVPTMEPVDFDCYGKEDGDYPFAQSCQVDYVSCVAGAAWKRTCPDELQFDPELRICNRLENIIACGGAPPTVLEPVALDYECPSPSGTFALASSLCSASYYICEDNMASIAKCSDDMIWDDSSKQCRLSSEIADCSFDCAGKADAPHSMGCSQHYWWCWEEKATKVACPEGMVFNSENNQCDFSANVFECTGQQVQSTTPLSDFAAPPAVDFDCTNVEDGNHAFLHGGHCQARFVSCVGGVAWELTCPDGLLFDPDQLLCERVERIVACGGSLEEPTTTQSYDYSYQPTVLPKIPKKSKKVHSGYGKKVKTTTMAEPTTTASYDSYRSYDTTRRPIKTTTPAAEPTTRDSYGSYDTTRRPIKTTTPAAEPTTRDSYYQKKTTTVNDVPITTRRSYGYKQTTTPAAEPTTTESYGSYEDTTVNDEPITTTRRSYGYKKTTTPAAEPTTTDSYYQTTPANEPTTKRSYNKIVRRLTTPARDIPTRASYYQKKTTPARDIPTRASYYQKKTTPAAEPTTRRSYYQTTTPAAEPTTTASYGSYEKTTVNDVPSTTRRSAYGYKQTTPAAEPTTRRQAYTRPVVRRRLLPKHAPIRRSYYKPTTPARDIPTRAPYYQQKTTPARDIPTRASYYQQKTTPARDIPTRASYYQKKTTPARDIPTRASYYQQKTTPARDIPTRASYYQQKTTPARDIPTRASYYQKTTPARDIPTRASYYQKTTPARDIPTRASYYQQKTTPARDIPTRASYYQKKTTPARDIPTRASYYQKPTTPAAEPTTRRSYYQTTTPAAEPTTRRSYKLTAAEPTTPKAEPEFKQASYY